MGMLEDDDLNRLRIDRMIFHVIGPEDSDLTLMDEVEIDGFEAFFLDRIRETNVGNRFQFIGAEQGVRPSLKSIADHPQNFVETTKELASSFHNQHYGAAKKGAFIVATLSGHSLPVFALIKFDDLRVLQFFHQQNKSGAVTAKVSEVNNTFQEDKKAMQKSALIVLKDDGGGDLAVYDRTNRKNVTEYFRAFLGVRRLYTPGQATMRLETALIDACAKHAKDMPQTVTSTWKSRLFDYTRDLTEVDTENMDAFRAAVFGEYGSNEAFINTLAAELQRQKISGEAIEIASAVIKKPTVRQVKTQEGVQVRIPVGLGEGVVNVQHEDDGRATITIKTRKILSNELVDEDPPRKA